MPAKGGALVGATETRAGHRSDTAVAVDLAGVRKRYGDVLALDGIDLCVRRGERVALLGPSGCGKSTLLEIVAGLEEPDGGSVHVVGASEPRARLAGCALMPQRDLLLPWRSALDNACIALQNQGLSRAEARARARPLFAELGLEEFERARPSQLSGGMRQRVAFLRTLLAGKELLLLDEPFGALDSLTRASLQGWLRDALARAPQTVLLVTHDVEEALLLADRVAVLSPRPGRVVAQVEVELPERATRREVVVSPSFVALRERVLEALE